MHWSLGVVNFTKRAFEYYDSLGNNKSFFHTIREYIRKECGSAVDVDDWTDKTFEVSIFKYL